MTKSILSIVACMMMGAGVVPAQVANWVRIVSTPHIVATVSSETGVPVVDVTYDGGGKTPGTAFFSAAFRVPPASRSDGISFEVRGDGSTSYASIFFASGSNRDVGLGYEAIFPLDSKDWKTVTLRWDSFVQSYIPWDPKVVDNDSSPQIDPSQLRLIGFGFGRYMFKFYPKQAHFQIRNVQLAAHLPKPEVPAFSKGWSHTDSLLGTGQTIKMLLIGDSITEFGNDHSYAVFFGKKITAKWGNPVEVANCGIRGHSIRGGMIILPRSIRTMPDPDLVFIMFGANDSTALGKKKEFNKETFKNYLEELIDRVRIATGGKADVCLMSGVVRIDPKTGKSEKIIEQIVGAVKEAAVEKQTAYVDTFATYQTFTAAQQKQYYLGKVHMNPAGLEFMGGLVFDKFTADLKNKP